MKNMKEYKKMAAFENEKVLTERFCQVIGETIGVIQKDREK